MSDPRLERLRVLADEIEAEMRAIGLWLEEPPDEKTVLSGGAFGLGTVDFDAWVQVVFVPRLRQVARGEFPIPEHSYVGTQAVREWDAAGPPDRDRLLGLISDVDDLIEGRKEDYSPELGSL